MSRRLIKLIAFVGLSAIASRAQEPPDTSAHTVQFVTVDKDVKLEVLDWGGKGRPLIFLAGDGNTAHVYGHLAPQFIANYHVYGITRRGFGASSKPAPTVANYNADRLGDDVLAVIDALKLNRPFVAGHSIAGEEMSSIGSHHPEKVAGLIYLDAGDAYAFYDPAHGDYDFFIDMFDLKQRMLALEDGATLDPKFVEAMYASVSQFEKDLKELSKRISLMPGPVPPAPPPIVRAINFGRQKYTEIHAPVLALFACPHNMDFIRDPAAKAALSADDLATCTAQSNAFEAGVQSAHVVRLPNANHHVFLSNEADVLREMNAFMAQIQ